MTARLDALAQQRATLVAESDQHRAALAASFDDVERRMWVVERVVHVARVVHKHRAIVGAVAVALVLLPRSARPKIRRAVQVVPLAVELIRMFWSRRKRESAS